MVTDDEADVAADVWTRGLSAAPWNGPPLWIHGDLHPANLVALGSRLVGIIDFGDVTAGDPAYDLAVAWLAFDRVGRAEFIAATGDRYDAATWVRAAGWATAVTLMLLNESDDNPAYAGLGAESLRELTS
jgi:aminoglycoside phosphotransferase (APT) family kinase protein